MSMADPTVRAAPQLKAPGKEDVVWALHTFEAENEDELTFEAGEKIVVLERDDQYGDGWFQVSSLRLRGLWGGGGVRSFRRRR